MTAAEDRVRLLEEELREVCDVAVWLSGLVNSDGEEWGYWENYARPRLYKAIAALAATTAPPERRSLGEGAVGAITKYGEVLERLAEEEA